MENVVFSSQEQKQILKYSVLEEIIFSDLHINTVL